MDAWRGAVHLHLCCLRLWAAEANLTSAAAQNLEGTRAEVDGRASNRYLMPAACTHQSECRRRKRTTQTKSALSAPNRCHHHYCPSAIFKGISGPRWILKCAFWILHFFAPLVDFGLWWILGGALGGFWGNVPPLDFEVPFINLGGICSF